MLVSVRGQEQLRDLARDLNKAGRSDLNKQLRGDIRDAMTPMRDAVRRNVLATPARGRHHTGLRRRTARATRVRIAPSSKAAVVLEIAPSLMPEGQRRLPALLDGSGGRWRHPVFGDRDVWVTQASHPFFWRGVEPHIKDVREAVIEATERVIDKYLAG